jgi:hypothetical protein
MYEALFVGSALWIALGGWFSFLSHGNKRCTGMLPIHTIVKKQPSWQLGHAKDIVDHPDIALSTVATVWLWCQIISTIRP